MIFFKKGVFLNSYTITGWCKWGGRNDYQSNYAGILFYYCHNITWFQLYLKDEVDNSVYSKMADDLEAASKRVKKRKVKKVKENASEISA